MFSQFDEDDNAFIDIDADLNHFQTLYPDLYNENQSQYYDLDKFNSINFQSNTDLAIIHINARSICSNFDQFCALFTILKHKFDIICISETWLDESLCNLYNFEDYHAYHSHRSTRGGGSSIYVRNIFQCSVINTNFNIEFANSILLNITHKLKSFIVGTFYRSQKADASNFIEHFSETLSNINHIKNNEIIVCGDFNFDLLKLDTCNISLDFFNAISSCFLIPMITKPTRVTESTATLLDNIFVKEPSSYLSGILESSITDHNPVFYIKKNFFPSCHDNSTITIRYRVINDDTIQLLRSSLLSCNLDEAVNDDVNISMENFANVLYSNFDMCCPIVSKTLSPKSLKCPWITNVIKSHIRKKDAYAKLYKSGKLSKILFNKYRNFVSNTIRKSKIKYFHDKFI